MTSIFRRTAASQFAIAAVYMTGHVSSPIQAQQGRSDLGYAFVNANVITMRDASVLAGTPF